MPETPLELWLRQHLDNLEAEIRLLRQELSQVKAEAGKALTREDKADIEKITEQRISGIDRSIAANATLISSQSNIIANSSKKMTIIIGALSVFIAILSAGVTAAAIYYGLSIERLAKAEASNAIKNEKEGINNLIEEIKIKISEAETFVQTNQTLHANATQKLNEVQSAATKMMAAIPALLTQANTSIEDLKTRLVAAEKAEAEAQAQRKLSEQALAQMVASAQTTASQLQQEVGAAQTAIEDLRKKSHQASTDAAETRTYRDQARAELSDIQEIKKKLDQGQKLTAPEQQKLQSAATAAQTAPEDKRSAEEWMTLGYAAWNAGKWGDAEAAFRQAAEKDPKDPWAWIMLSRVHHTLGAFPAARAAAEKAVKAAQARVTADPNNSAHRDNLGQAHLELGNAAAALGDQPGAQKAYRATREVYQELVRRHPQDTSYLYSLAVAQSFVGDAALDAGDRAGARTAYEQALRIYQDLTARDGTNRGWRSELGVAWGKIGDVERAEGRQDKALAAYEQFLKIAQALQALEPANRDYQADVGVAWNKVAITARATGDQARAQRGGETSRQTFQELVAADPLNVYSKARLGLAWGWMGTIHADAKEIPQAKAAYKQALEILKGLDREGKLDAYYKDRIPLYEKELKALDKR